MKNNLTLLSCAVISTLLLGCGGSESPFSVNGNVTAGNIDMANFTVAPTPDTASPQSVSVTYSDGITPDPFDGVTILPVTDILSIDSTTGNITVSIEVQGADKNRFKVSGSEITFQSNFGIIEPSCTLSSGSCSMTLLTTNISRGLPPLLPGAVYNGYENFDSTPPNEQRIYANIVGYTSGEESYNDLNGNGFFDDGDDFLLDTDEPFIDNNANGVFDDGIDIPIDVDNSGGYTPVDGLYSGANCQHSTLCSPNSSIVIWDSVYIDLVN
ncbi:MAG: hypothetical protein OQK46_04410 [Gammaproteobacteria bacterium]|nr:hypothetical protein [Gammaproteobacteria bacterium]